MPGRRRAAFFDADRKEACRVLQDARAYVADFDRDGRKAEALYKRIERADRRMSPWSTDGTAAQSKKAIEYIEELRSVLSAKIGPASRHEFPEQRSLVTPSQIERDVSRMVSETPASRSVVALSSLAPPTPVLTPAIVLSAVRDALPRVGSEGRYDQKVFVSALWRVLETDPRFRALSLDQFKRWLLAANRDGDVRLARADLVGAMDRSLVSESEIVDHGTMFHFVIGR